MQKSGSFPWELLAASDSTVTITLQVLPTENRMRLDCVFVYPLFIEHNLCRTKYVYVLLRICQVV